MIGTRPTRRVVIALFLMFVVWFALAADVGASGRLLTLKPPAPQIILAALTLALVLFYNLNGSFRRWAWQLDLRALVSLHLTRFIGVYFLLLYRRGELPRAFAVPAGIGDIFVASLALLLIALSLKDRRVYLAWNVVGLTDILFVVAIAARLGLRDPASMQNLLRLPLSLLPTFLVPLIIGTHLLIFVRLRNASHLPLVSSRSY